MPQLSLDNVKDLAGVDPIDVVRSVLAESGGLARLMEMHYLASDPELFALIRAIAALPPADRLALAEFLRERSNDKARVQRTEAPVRAGAARI